MSAAIEQGGIQGEEGDWDASWQRLMFEDPSSTVVPVNRGDLHDTSLLRNYSMAKELGRITAHNPNFHFS